MMLKRILGATLTVLAVAAANLSFGTAAYAQGGGEAYLELLRSDIKTQKTALVTEAMQLSDDEASVFWPIYREYQFELDKLTDRRIALIKDYAQHYNSMTDEKANELMMGVFKLDEDLTKLRKKYYKQLEKALSSTTAARFFQIDNQINMLLRLQVAAELPLIKAPAKD